MNVEREKIIGLITQACHAGAKQENACEIIGISAKTFQRWNVKSNKQDGRLEPRHRPKHKLTELECQRIIKVANESEYSNLPPCQIVPRLADKGIYIASEASFYRVLNEHNQLKHRDKSKPARQVNKPRALTANAPNQIYSWDITYLPTQVKGIFLYLYLVIDIYSRKIVGWQVHHEELSILAADLMTDICHREKIEKNHVTLHSDNGSPMKGATMLATLEALGIVPSFSRPSVSNDNPYSESVFRTLKYRPEYPEKAFTDISDARAWVGVFVNWYNHEHRHSGIKFTTPQERHTGKDIEILAKRRQVYQQAKLTAPNRWSGDIKNWDHIEKVYLNPEKEKSQIKESKAA
jgi:transposase InsO family protein